MNLVKKDYQSLLQQNAQSIQGLLASTTIYFKGKLNSYNIKKLLSFKNVANCA